MTDPRNGPETGDAVLTPPSPSPLRRLASADLPARIVAGLAMMAIALAAAWAGGAIFAAFWLLAALLMHWEWQRLIGGAHFGLRFALGALGLLAAAPLAAGGAAWAAIAAVVVGALAACLGGGRPLRLMPGAGVVYAGGMLVAVCLLRAGGAHGAAAIFWLFAVVWGTDVMAFAGGRIIGGPKLWPRLSPAKTWSGFAVGVCCGAAAGLLAAPAATSIPAIFALGLIAGAVAQGGDLLESALKRRYGVKDSSHLIPGHGGLLDRLDGFTTASIFAAFVGAARYGLADIGAGLFQW